MVWAELFDQLVFRHGFFVMIYSKSLGFESAHSLLADVLEEQELQILIFDRMKDFGYAYAVHRIWARTGAKNVMNGRRRRGWYGYGAGRSLYRGWERHHGLFIGHLITVKTWQWPKGANPRTAMGLYLLDYGAGNVQSLANSLTKLGHEFLWISSPDDFQKATVGASDRNLYPSWHLFQSLVFPGVGAFHTAIEQLSSRGLLEPLREYIQQGRPYFGICIGLQVLFRSSSESPNSPGLGIIPSDITRFQDVDKSVPHIGWNAANPLEEDGSSEYYYFVHSYCAKYDPDNDPAAAQWTHTTAQYGNEIFISTIRKGDVFATQFHPEKSGPAGLRLLHSWLTRANTESVSSLPRPPIALLPKAKDGLTKRIIACMDIRANDEGDLVVTKGDQYDVREKTVDSTDDPSRISANTAGRVRNLGKPVALAARYYDEGADEICLLNITSFRYSPLQDQPMLAVVRAAAQRVFIPLTIGGGIKDTVDPDGTKRTALEVAGVYFRAGADKVSIGSEAVYAVEKMRARGGVCDGTSAIETIAQVYGRQAVVVSIDPRRVSVDPSTYAGPYQNELVHGKSDGPVSDRGRAWWYQCTVSGGRECRPLSVVELAQGAELLGAGEILLNSIDRDGTGLGFDLELINLVKSNVKIPVVASSGAGSKEHFVELFNGTQADAALAAGIFHREEVSIREVKDSLRAAGISNRALSTQKN
jgi:imidazole glycerol-phosphate synthase